MAFAEFIEDSTIQGKSRYLRADHCSGLIVTWNRCWRAIACIVKKIHDETITFCKVSSGDSPSKNYLNENWATDRLTDRETLHHVQGESMNCRFLTYLYGFQVDVFLLFQTAWIVESRYDEFTHNRHLEKFQQLSVSVSHKNSNIQRQIVQHLTLSAA